MYQVLHAGEDSITDERWRQYFEFLTELKKRYHTPYTLVSWQTTRDRTMSQVKDEKGSHRALVMKDGRLVAFIGQNGRNIGTPRQSAFFVFDFLDEFTGPELERTILDQIGKWMDRYALAESFSIVNDAHREGVVRRWGARELSRVDEYVLERRSACREVIDGWLKEIPKKHSDLELRFYQMLPDEYIDPFSVLLAETLRAMPQESDGALPFHTMVQNEKKAEAWRQKNGISVYKYLLFDPDDNMIALTLVSVDLNNPTNVFQLMTGVTEKLRFQGLAKWLKAAMFYKLEEDCPGNEKIITGMRSLNRPMQAINSQMGFELARRGFEFKLTPEIIATCST